MNSSKTMSRLGMVIAGGAALVSFGMMAPAQAAPTGGANGDCGAYCANPGMPSGNGGGHATTQPAAGTKGKADNKFPPGQAPDGTDHNNGYECDGNNGVALGNPAHTGCGYPSSS